jgi:hydrogenase expression/formation protein HypE
MKLTNHIVSDCAPLNDIVDALFENSVNVKAMRDVTRGGLGTMLNEFAATSGCGIEIEEAKIPVRDEVQGFCDILGLDPLYMGNEGKMLVVVAADDAEKALSLVKGTERGKDAVLLGEVTAGKGVVMKTRLGGNRVVDMLYGEGLPRIC